MKTLLENELDGVDKEIDAIEKQKDQLQENITKLEESIKSLDASLTKNLNEEDAAQVVDQKFVIEKQINAFKDQYVTLEAKKKKLYETQTITMGKNYNIDETVQLKDGRTGKVTGVDKHAGRYMVRTEDGKISPFRSGDFA
jgi:phage shock protein A